jgi:hypothetical protein
MDGYLLSLRRLCRDKCDFWAEILDNDGDLEGCMKRHFARLELTPLDKTPAGYQEIEALLINEFSSKLNINDDALVKSFVWDLLEYFEHAFLEYPLQADPINMKQSFIIKTKSRDLTVSYHIIVPEKTKAIAVGLANRTEI